MKRQLSILMLGGLLFVTCGWGPGKYFFLRAFSRKQFKTNCVFRDASQALQNKDWPKAMKYYQTDT